MTGLAVSPHCGLFPFSLFFSPLSGFPFVCRSVNPSLTPPPQSLPPQSPSWLKAWAQAWNWADKHTASVSCPQRESVMSVFILTHEHRRRQKPQDLYLFILSYEHRRRQKRQDLYLFILSNEHRRRQKTGFVYFYPTIPTYEPFNLSFSNL